MGRINTLDEAARLAGKPALATVEGDFAHGRPGPSTSRVFNGTRSLRRSPRSWLHQCCPVHNHCERRQHFFFGEFVDDDLLSIR